MVHKFPFYKLNSITARFSTSSVNYKNKDFNTYLDNSNTNSIQNRENGIYKIYDNLFINNDSIPNIYDVNDRISKIDKFTLNLTQILEDLYDNNESTIFHLYFLIKPDFNKVIKFDLVNLNQHFAKFPLEFIDENIVKFYKNTGLLSPFGILVFFPTYDINNLIRISSKMKDHIKNNIEIINSLVDKDFNQTIVNYENKFENNSEIMLMIHADFDKIKI